MNALTRGLLLGLVLLAGNPSLAGEIMKPNIVILATGGTIAGAAETGTQAGYTSGQVGVQTLIDAVPQMTEVAEIRGARNAGSAASCGVGRR